MLILKKCLNNWARSRGPKYLNTPSKHTFIVNIKLTHAMMSRKSMGKYIFIDTNILFNLWEKWKNMSRDIDQLVLIILILVKLLPWKIVGQTIYSIWRVV